MEAWYSKDVVLRQKKTLDSVLDTMCFRILFIEDEMLLHISKIYIPYRP